MHPHRRIASRTALFGTKFSSEGDIIREFEEWDAEDAEALADLEDEKAVTRKITRKTSSKTLKF